MRRLFLASILCLATILQLAAQAKDTVAKDSAVVDTLPELPGGRTLLAATNDEYPVTPGDTYTLYFLRSTQQTRLAFFVETDFSLNLAIFGKTDAKGLSFRQLKAKVEALVERSYPGSSPQLVLSGTGVFAVQVEGEAIKAGLVQAWGLSRLSEIFDTLRTPYSSNRKIQVRSLDGRLRYYDLFKSYRMGDLSQDPLLKPSDVITFLPYERKVRIEGEVIRPGEYQLLPTDGIGDLVESYAAGLLPTARNELAQLVRLATKGKPEGELLFIDPSYPASKLPNLLDGDTLIIPKRETYLPVVYFEGAISVPTQDTAATVKETASTAKAPNPTPKDTAVDSQYGTYRYPFKPGDTLSRALRILVQQLAPNADLRRAFIARKNKAQTIPVDLEKLLYAYDPGFDILLQAEDRIVIPTGSLNIFVSGEVAKSGWVSMVELTRLSTAIKPLLTKYSSIRDIVVRNLGGEELGFDLFRAERYGDLGQDPFLKPGDTVMVKKALYPVSITGEVQRPGTYQLLAGEGMKELVDVYGAGFTENANTALIAFHRAPAANRLLGSTSYIAWSDSARTALEAFDRLVVPSLNDLLPVVYFEGAIGVGEKGENPEAARQLIYTYVPGDTISRAIQNVRKQISEVSDIEKAYILRGGKKIPVNLALYLYDKDFSNDIALEANDRVIIPFRQFFVSVSGAVNVPGRYPYVPDRGWEYYVNLAGGFDMERNSGDRVKILDMDSKPKTKDRFIQPEDSIVAASNSFFYYFGKVSTIITTISSILSIIVITASLTP